MIDKKDPNPNPGSTSDPSVASPDEENPWDDAGGGRTLAQDGPSFEMPSNIPSPITVPPPAARVAPPQAVPGPIVPAPAPARPAAPAPPGRGANPPKPRSATMMGFGPPGPPLPGQTGPGLPMGGGMGFTPAGGMPAVKPAAPAAPAPSAPRPQSSPGLGTNAGPPSSDRRPPPRPPRPLGAAPAPAPAPPAPAPPAPASPSAGVVSSNPPPGEAGAANAEEEWANASQQDDGPTMAVASPGLASRPLRDDVAHLPKPSTAAPRVDKDAETMALGGDDPRLPKLDDDADGESDVEETTRAVSRDELIRHQDASFVVGNDAMGDEATLAVAPGQIDLGLGANGMAAALADSIKRESQGNLPAGPHAFPAPPHAHPGMGMQAQAQPPAWGGGEQAPWHASPDQPPPWAQPQAMGGAQQQGAQQQGFDPMMHGAGSPQSNPGMPGAYPQSGQHPLMQQHGAQAYPMPGAMGGYGPNANAPTAQQPRPGEMMPGQAPWMVQGPPGAARPIKFTPQVLLLVGVGAVCLAIFIIGIVLFVTTKF